MQAVHKISANTHCSSSNLGCILGVKYRKLAIKMNLEIVFLCVLSCEDTEQKMCPLSMFFANPILSQGSTEKQRWALLYDSEG